jgi:cytochrome P450
MLGGKSVADNNRLIDYAAGQVQLREAEGKNMRDERTDFLSRLVGVEDKKTRRRPTSTYLCTESLNLINAGSDPFSSVLAGAFFYLVHDPDALKKATQEVRAAFTSPSEIVNGPVLNECVYLYAVIEETLRRTAPVPSHLPRFVLSGGIVVDGEHIPEGTVVGVPMYALHHNPDYFPNPFVFSPERWIQSKNNSAETISRARQAFFPFSVGSRTCSGKAQAYLQLKLTLAHLLWRFDMRESPEEIGRGGGREGLALGRERIDEFQLWDALGIGRDGPMVEVKVAQ